MRHKWCRPGVRTRKKSEDFQTPEQWLSLIEGPPNQPSEFEIQATLWYGLRALGLIVRGEVHTRCRRFRFDLLVYVDGRPDRIIEVKKRPLGTGRKTPMRREIGRQRREQLAAYSRFGLAVDSVCGMKEAEEYLRRAMSLYPHLNSNPPAPAGFTAVGSGEEGDLGGQLAAVPSERDSTVRPLPIAAAL